MKGHEHLADKLTARFVKLRKDGTKYFSCKNIKRQQYTQTLRDSPEVTGELYTPIYNEFILSTFLGL